MPFDFRRTHRLDALREKDQDREVTLSGWVDRRRDHGGLIFIDLRDRFGVTQLVLDPELIGEAKDLRSEWVISVKGIVRKRKEGMINPKLLTGEIEVSVSALHILSKAKTPPFSICDEEIDTNEELRLKFRFLDIRRGKIQENLVKRHQAMHLIRNFLHDQGFLELTTPILGKSTPEGARDYLVPSRIYPGSFFALPQSPQLFKQLFMVAGMDRYFQIAQCFRDEDLRADRQPEFTQIDVEMSFETEDVLMSIMENMIKALFENQRDVKITLPFKRMSHKEAMDRYGTDKPDLRFEMPLVEISDIVKESSFSVFLDALNNEGIVKAIVVKGGSDLSRKSIDDYTSFVGHLGIKGLAWMKFQEGKLTSNIVKFFPESVQKDLIERANIEENDLIFMIADEKSKTNQALDHLRRKIASDRNLIDEERLEFLWVTDFPLFEWSEEEGRLTSVHHPFTSPIDEDLPLLDTDPSSVRSSGYDMVLNGYEIGGGSKRIHNLELQSKIFKLLGISEKEQKSRFGFFLDALSYGAPPHLGMAFGLDRIMMIICNTDSIRDVIAFPKTQKSADLMLDCPSNVGKRQLNELKLSIEN